MKRSSVIVISSDDNDDDNNVVLSQTMTTKKKPNSSNVSSSSSSMHAASSSSSSSVLYSYNKSLKRRHANSLSKSQKAGLPKKKNVQPKLRVKSVPFDDIDAFAVISSSAKSIDDEFHSKHISNTQEDDDNDEDSAGFAGTKVFESMKLKHMSNSSQSSDTWRAKSMAPSSSINSSSWKTNCLTTSSDDAWMEASGQSLLTPSSKAKSSKNVVVSKVKSNGNLKSTTTTRSEHVLWTDKYTPRSMTELAVSKQRSKDLYDWLTWSLSKNKGTIMMNGVYLRQILLLTGPPGCGKTTTLRVAAAEMGAKVCEWENPVPGILPAQEQRDLSIDNDTSKQGTNVMALLRDFVTRVGRYNTILVNDKHTANGRILLFEDLPNVLQNKQKTEEFHDLLRHAMRHGRYPIVFIVSDTTAGDNEARNIFPREWMDGAAIHEISFNKVTQSALKTAMKSILEREVTSISETYVMQLAAASNGDVRYAINNLMFACLQDVAGTPSLGTKRKKRTTTTTSTEAGSRKKKTTLSDKAERTLKEQTLVRSGLGLKDTGRVLFHTIGKVMNVKRLEEDELDELRTHPTLSDHARRPLKSSADDIIQRSDVTSIKFTMFLHEHGPTYFQDLDDYARALDYVGDADVMAGSWEHRETINEYASLVACRGVMHSNRNVASVGFAPMHGPQLFDIERRLRTNDDAVSHLSCRIPVDNIWLHLYSPRAIREDIVPFIYLIPHARRHFSLTDGTLIRDIAGFELTRPRKGSNAHLSDFKEPCIYTKTGDNTCYDRTLFPPDDAPSDEEGG